MTITTFPISEHFLSIQGEGWNVGCRSYFIRFHECNLRCTFCDSKFTWEEVREKKGTAIAQLSTNDILDLVNKSQSSNVVLTGGEPLLYDLTPIIEKLHTQQKTIEIESNGTLIPNFNGTNIRWNISPKFRNCNEVIHPDSLHFWSNMVNRDLDPWRIMFKFVARNTSDLNQDLDDIQSIIREFRLPTQSVYIMAEGNKRNKQLETMDSFVNEIIHRGWNFSPRIHTLIWDGAKGV